MSENIISSARLLEQIQNLLQLYTKLDTNISNIVITVDSIQRKIDILYDKSHNLMMDIEILKKDRNIIGYSEKIESIEEKAIKLKEEVHRIEMIVNALKIFEESNKQRWGRVIDISFKVAVTLGTGYLLYLFGIGAPP